MDNTVACSGFCGKEIEGSKNSLKQKEKEKEKEVLVFFFKPSHLSLSSSLPPLVGKKKAGGYF